MKNNQNKFMKKLDNKYPLATKYLKRNESSIYPTKQDSRGEGVFNSITLQVYPNTGVIPKEKVIKQIWDYLKGINKYSGVEESILQFVVKGDDGKQNVVRNVIFKEPGFEEYEVEGVADCGQKVILLFNDKDHYEKVYPIIVERGYINKMAPEFIKDEPIVFSIQPLICGDSNE